MSEATAVNELRETAEPVWITLGFDPVHQEIQLVGIAESRKQCRKHYQRTEACYVNSFNMMDPELLPSLHDWLVSTGMSAERAPEAMRALGRCLQEVMRPQPKDES